MSPRIAAYEYRINPDVAGNDFDQEVIMAGKASLLKTLLVASLLPFLAGSAQGGEWKSLKDRTETLTVEGQAVTIIVRSEMATTDLDDGGIRLDLKSRAGLDDLQDKAPAILLAVAAAKSSCSTRWSFPRVDRPSFADTRMIVSGEVRVEKWICDNLFGDHKLLSQSAAFSISATALVEDNKGRLAATVDQLDLGGLIGELGVDGELRRVLQDALGKALGGEDASISFPEELQPLDPRIVSLAIVPLEGGRGELVAEATATLGGADDLMAVLELLDQ